MTVTKKSLAWPFLRNLARLYVSYRVPMQFSRHACAICRPNARCHRFPWQIRARNQHQACTQTEGVGRRARYPLYSWLLRSLFGRCAAVFHSPTNIPVEHRRATERYSRPVVAQHAWKAVIIVSFFAMTSRCYCQRFAIKTCA